MEITISIRATKKEIEEYFGAQLNWQGVETIEKIMSSRTGVDVDLKAFNAPSGTCIDTRYTLEFSGMKFISQ